MAPGGIFVTVGGSISLVLKSLLFGGLLSFGSKKIKFLYAKANVKDMEFLAKLLENGKIKSVIERCYPLERTADAMKYLSQGHASGKLVIKLE